MFSGRRKVQSNNLILFCPIYCKNTRYLSIYVYASLYLFLCVYICILKFIFIIRSIHIYMNPVLLQMYIVQLFYLRFKGKLINFIKLVCHTIADIAGYRINSDYNQLYLTKFQLLVFINMQNHSKNPFLKSYFK